MTRIGQNTGMLKKSKNVQTKAIAVAFVAEYQNLNSGNLKTQLKTRYYIYALGISVVLDYFDYSLKPCFNKKK